MNRYIGKSADAIQPGDPPYGESRKEKLMRPNAVERPDTQTGTNDLKAYVGGSGKPKGPFGQRGRM